MSQSNYLRALAGASLLALTALSAHAAGSSAVVRIAHFERFRETQYVLVVEPQPSATGVPDAYMGKCAKFTIHGDFKQLKGAWFWSEKQVTREEHLKALTHIADAFHNNRNLNLGWMGEGFERTDKKNPCDVESRALVLMNVGANADQLVVVSRTDVI